MARRHDSIAEHAFSTSTIARSETARAARATTRTTAKAASSTRVPTAPFCCTSAAVASAATTTARPRRQPAFVLQSQQADGSWPYAIDGVRDFVDHFHTCFVLKALAKIEALTLRAGAPLRQSITPACRYYVQNLFDDRRPAEALRQGAPADGLPPRAVRLRRVHQRRDLARGTRSAELDARLGSTLEDVLGALAQARRLFPLAPSSCSAGTTSRCIAGRSRRLFRSLAQLLVLRRTPRDPREGRASVARCGARDRSFAP